MEQIQIKRSAQDLLNILKPVGIALDKLPSDSVYLGDVVEVWFQLSSVFPEEYLPKIATRWNLQPLFYAANLLDHRRHGYKLDHAEVCKAMEYINECENDVAPEVSKYLVKMAPYSPFLFADNYNNVSPRAWWIAGEKVGFDKQLVLLASSLVAACPSLSGLKRCFSTLGFTYGKLRSQLGMEKAGKLAFVFRQFNSLIVISLPKIKYFSYIKNRFFFSLTHKIFVVVY